MSIIGKFIETEWRLPGGRWGVGRSRNCMGEWEGLLTLWVSFLGDGNVPGLGRFTTL